MKPRNYRRYRNTKKSNGMGLPIKVFAASLGVSLLVLAVIFFAFWNRGDTHYTDAIVQFPSLEHMVYNFPHDMSLEDDDLYDEGEYEAIDLSPRALLTGLPIDEAYVNRRPVAVVINNLRRALPQSGLASADIIYEALAEGDVTRLVAIFQSDLPDVVGPVRSTRDYFVDFAFNHDAVFVHHGGSPTGYTRIRNTGITALDGMNLEGTIFWRNRTYPSWHFNSGTRPLEHSSFAGWNPPSNAGSRIIGIHQHIENQGIRDYIGDDGAFGFNFEERPEDILSFGTAHRVHIPFSTGSPRIFIYDFETGLYLVENRDGAHEDALDREQVAVANVLIQFAPMRVVDGVGRRDIDTVGEGTGYLITGGLYFPVRWVKSSHTAPMRWYFEDGVPMTLTPGATWINVFQNTGTVDIE
ncbi:MAG: DUF3048 domain-containing protein [Defluviitaleaceae bacterium]|nr:DUF3048 domain-containing protein [Defluviitaleaceae bacterium]